MWVVRVGGDNGELRSWHYIYAYSIESRLMMRKIYESKSRCKGNPNFLFQGRDVIAQSQSGTGKTAMLSIVSLQLIDTATREVQVGARLMQRERERDHRAGGVGGREGEGERE